MDRRTFLSISGSGLATGALSGCGGGSDTQAGSPAPSLKTVLSWNEAALDAVRATKLGPPMVARSLAVVHTAMYDAWAAYDDVALSSTRGTVARRPLQERSAANRAKAMSFAAHAALLDQFPTQKAAFDARLGALGFAPSQMAAEPSTAEGVGRSAARA